MISPFPPIQAVENVSTVMANLLKTQTKMENLTEKLQQLGTPEGEQQLSCNCYICDSHMHVFFLFDGTAYFKRNLMKQIRSMKKIDQFSKQLEKHHDELADLKSYFDAQNSCCLDPEEGMLVKNHIKKYIFNQPNPQKRPGS